MKRYIKASRDNGISDIGDEYKKKEFSKDKLKNNFYSTKNSPLFRGVLYMYFISSRLWML